MTSTRAFFEQKHDISSQQRTAGSIFWGQLLHGERKIPQSKASSADALQNEMVQLLTINDPSWHNKFTMELDSLIFEHRHESNLKLKSDSLPEGVLLEAAKTCKIPLSVFPTHVSMTFSENNSLLVNDKKYSANQIISDELGLFAKPKPQEPGHKTMNMGASSKTIFDAIKTKPALLTLGLIGAGVGLLANSLTNDGASISAAKSYMPI